ncbi:chemotaxis protein CheC [Thalassospira profundimaris]|uniref:Chemotaxis protein CheC n=1 Tax=Thalassospira profundimaris TaxID=502049 RepID=A0A367X024_9PROT|nr:chemotaxis protein CheC [Thalassospira profundimaris]RCK47036.1 chemotaxis protein CheC [Thalassospira profundimaris]
MIDLSDLERDTITELINIGVGRAAASLSEMVDQSVELTVPSISFVQRFSDANLIAAPGEVVSAVTQSFNGPFNGDALLVFPEKRSLELVRRLLQVDVPLDSLGDLEQEALMEVGNIILNACLGSISNILGHPINCSMPIFRKCETRNLMPDACPPGTSETETTAPFLLILHVQFMLRENDIDGYVLFVMDLDSIQTLKRMVNRYLENALG